jgi:hypothetical protein
MHASYGLVDKRESMATRLVEEFVKIAADRLVEGSETAWSELVVGGRAWL